MAKAIDWSGLRLVPAKSLRSATYEIRSTKYGLALTDLGGWRNHRGWDPM